MVILLAWTSAEEWHSYGLAGASTCLVSKLIELRTNWTKLTLMNPPWPPNQGDLQPLPDTVLASRLSKKSKTYYVVGVVVLDLVDVPVNEKNFLEVRTTFFSFFCEMAMGK